jgi:hypothetical protein
MCRSDVQQQTNSPHDSRHWMNSHCCTIAARSLNLDSLLQHPTRPLPSVSSKPWPMMPLPCRQLPKWSLHPVQRRLTCHWPFLLGLVLSRNSNHTSPVRRQEHQTQPSRNRPHSASTWYRPVCRLRPVHLPRLNRTSPRRSQSGKCPYLLITTVR